MANTLMTLLVSLGIDTADFQKGIQGAEKSVGSFTKSMVSTGKTMQKVGGAMTLGLTVPIVAFGASAIKSATDAESALADLNAVLKSTGGIAGITLDELTKNAAALQKVTKFSDESVMSAQGMLLTFTKIGKDIFPDATMAALDMAEKFGMDASQAAITLGKALNDPIAGVGALRRIGVQLTDQQEEQIKSFMAVGDIASAQKIIMQELAVEIGGVAEAAGATSGGQFAQFTNQLDDMKEIIGTALIPVLIRFMEAITPLIIRFSEASPAMQNTIIAFGAIVAAAGPVITVIGTLVTTIGTLAPILTTVFTFITATAIPALATFATAVLLPLAPLLLIIATLALVFYAFKTNFGGITTTVQQLWFLIKYAFDNIVNKIKEAIAWVGNLIKAFLGIKAPNLGGQGVPPTSRLNPTRDSGGAGIAGTPYNIGVPEVFVPKTSGEFIPLGGAKGKGLGTTYNIVVNNPKKETAENSIRSALKNLSYMGQAA